MTRDASGSVYRPFVDRHPAGSFFALALAYSWAIWIPGFQYFPDGTGGTVALVLGGFGPALAAATVTRLRGASVRAWLSAVFGWRRPLRWYAFAFAIPISLAAALVGVLLAAGAVTGAGTLTALVDGAEASSVGLLVVNVLVGALLIASAGGGQEEFGWRGFALPHLQERYDALTASLAIGVVWTLWHAPLFVFGYYDRNPALYGLSVLALAILFTWYYNRSRGCLLGAMVLHGTYNATVHLPARLPDVDQLLPISEALLQVTALWIVALAIVAFYGRETLADGDAVRVTWSAAHDGDPDDESGNTVVSVGD